MERTIHDFDDNNGTRRIINHLIHKITSGEFEIERFDISRSSDRQEANVKLKINGGPISILQPDQRQEHNDTSSADTGDETSMTPDEKKVQAQIASCYM